LSESRQHLTVLPSAVRKCEVKEAAFFARLLAFKQPLGTPREFENVYPLVHVRPTGSLMQINPALAPILLGPPFGRLLIVEAGIHATVKLVHVHGIKALLKAVPFGTQSGDHLLLLSPLIGVAGLKSLPHPCQHLLVEA